MVITYCVRQYKAECVTRYDQIIVTADSAEELRRSFAEAMAATLREDAAMHRLWYDLRNQSLFEESFRDDVLAIDQSLERMIWRIVSLFAELVGSPPAVSSPVAYALFDGLFQQALLRQLSGRDSAAADLTASVAQLLDQLVVHA